VEWIDVRDWVLDTYPWKNSSDMKNLNTVAREDVGFVQGNISLLPGIIVMSLMSLNDLFGNCKIPLYVWYWFGFTKYNIFHKSNFSMYELCDWV